MAEPGRSPDLRPPGAGRTASSGLPGQSGAQRAGAELGTATARQPVSQSGDALPSAAGRYPAHRPPRPGFAAGMHTDVSTHGPGGYAAVTAATIGEAIELAQHYAPLRQHLATFVVEQRDPPVLRLDEHLVPLAVRDYLLGHFTTGMLRLLETVSGQPLGPELTLEWPGAKPDWADAVRDYAANWVFDGDALRLHLPAGLLEQPCLGADAELHRHALRDCEHQLQRQQSGGDLSQRIKQRLLQCEYHYPTLAQTAEQEHLTART
ncbi:AraC family transcriptional regulator ligand-binding domain-containing protein [Halopseudomonas pachastrellae]|nr:AraC family transcriptional regulator ligand-binding domain-containing protein [Halopseudomonas pachastrellae]